MKIINLLKSVMTGLIISGVIVILAGMYYLVVKAGIPYQDAPTELQIRYAVNMGIGEGLFGIGLLIGGVGLVGRIVFLLTDRSLRK
ncbi:MAG: hypothetical protein K6E50_04840 [Lachnospiraceae bacterium]|nr:hypothetical protein [Lachnospiraceae bacterium]